MLADLLNTLRRFSLCRLQNLRACNQLGGRYHLLRCCKHTHSQNYQYGIVRACGNHGFEMLEEE